MGLVVERKDVGRHHHAGARVPADRGRGDGGPVGRPRSTTPRPQSSNSKALAGSHVLVVASRREMRVDDPRRAAQHEHAGRLRQLGRRGGELLQGRPAARDHRRVDPARRAASPRSATRSSTRCRTSSSSRSSSRARPSRCRAPTARPWRGSAATSIATSLPAALMFELSQEPVAAAGRRCAGASATCRTPSPGWRCRCRPGRGGSSSLPRRSSGRGRRAPCR